MHSMSIQAKIRTIPDFPKPGIMFRDVTTLFKDPTGFGELIDVLAKRYVGARIDTVVGIESRGFIVGAPLAVRLGCGFVPLRKPGKLPAATWAQPYELEYGTDELHVHIDAIAEGERVLLIDDLLATGGTMLAGVALMRRAGAEIVECTFVVDLPEVGGRQRLESEGLPVHAVCVFDGH